MRKYVQLLCTILFNLFFVLSRPLAPNEVLPKRTHYEAPPQRPEGSDEVDTLPSEPVAKKKLRSKKTKKDKKEKSSKKAKKEGRSETKKKASTEEDLILGLVDPLKEMGIDDDGSAAANHMNGTVDAKEGDKVSDSFYCLFIVRTGICNGSLISAGVLPI